MRPDHIVHRTWLKDGEVWLEREEAWDSAAYGAAGTLSAVSIYDFEVGLDPGAYLLQLRINGQIQQEAAFDILASGATEFVTLALSSETRVAKVINGRLLVVEDMAGNQRELALVNEEIVDLRWFSDGRHLLYVEVAVVGRRGYEYAEPVERIRREFTRPPESLRQRLHRPLFGQQLRRRMLRRSPASNHGAG
jgi:hypothetical protein